MWVDLLGAASWPVCGKQVTCSTASTDGYEHTNLVGDPDQRAVGFLAASFARPPVSVTFEFCTDVDIERVLVDPRVLSHATQTVTVAASRSSLCDTAGWDFVGKVDGNTGQTGQGPVPHLCLLNQHYQQSGASGVSEPKDRVGPRPSRPHTVVCHFKSGSVLKHLRCLRLTVTRCSRSSIPALKQVCIFGQPSNRAVRQRVAAKRGEALHHEPRVLGSGVLVPKFVSLFGGSSDGDNVQDTEVWPVVPSSSSRKRSRPTDTHHHQRHEVRHANGGSQSAAADVFCIPDTFVDAITYELMARPVTLPCRKVIDSSTLARHFANSMTDPFTGVAMTEEDAVPHVTLKEQIDRFRLTHQGALAASAAQNHSAARHRNLAEPFSGAGYRLGGSGTTDRSRATSRRLKQSAEAAASPNLACPPATPSLIHKRPRAKPD
eukprot:m.148275 g.148275  ORF g.148275 m.148275 type:complete len:433 (-) comp17309_c0_seq6:1951-3249(-)